MMKTRPTILVVAPGTVIGGAEIYLVRLTALLHSDTEFLVLCFNFNLHTRLLAQGIKSICTPLPKTKWIARLLKYLLLLVTMPWMIIRYRVRFVHLNGYQASYLAIVAYLMKRTTIITPHHLPREARVRTWYRFTARWVDSVISVSEAAAVDHQTILPSINPVTICNWVPDRLQHIPLRTHETPFRLLFIGRLVKAKGLYVLLDAVRQLGDQIELTVCGEGPLKVEFQKYAEGLPVSFVGFVPDLAALYREADAVVIPSLGPEGSCLVALEAMNAGIPCIMSNLPAYREIAENGRSALLFNAGDPSDLGRAISILINDPALFRCLSVRAKEMVLKKYVPEVARHAYCKVFGLGEG